MKLQCEHYQEDDHRRTLIQSNDKSTFQESDCTKVTSDQSVQDLGVGGWFRSF